MSRIEIDTSDLLRLERDFARGFDRVRGQVPGVVRKAAVNVKRDWRAGAKRSAGAHGKHYHRAITFDDAWHGPDVYAAEIGPDTSRPQGGRGAGFEFGSVNQAPHLDGWTATDTEEPRFERACAGLLDGLL